MVDKYLSRILMHYKVFSWGNTNISQYHSTRVDLCSNKILVGLCFPLNRVTSCYRHGAPNHKQLHFCSIALSANIKEYIKIRIIGTYGREPISELSISVTTWWRHQMETFFALLAICAGNSPVTGEFPSQRPATRSFDVFFDLRLNKQLSKQSWGWWFETLSRPLWRHYNGVSAMRIAFRNYDVIM